MRAQILEATNLIDFIKWTQDMPVAQMYRGQSDENWGLFPGIYRYFNQTDQGDFDLLNTERLLVEKFQFFSLPIRDYRKCRYMEKVVHAQHYGVPTRLLDWTTNPLKALYFAVQDNDYRDVDGVVHFYGPEGWWESMTPEHLHEAFDGEGLVTFHPELLNERIAGQEACFTSFPLLEGESNVREMSEENYPGEIEFLGRVVIPAEAKDELKYQLVELGINHMTMFPGLEGVAKHVKTLCSGFKM